MAKHASKKQIRAKSEDMSSWYTDVILRSDMADYSPVRGSMVLKPYGYAIWERIKEELDQRLKKLGCENAYFPLFIPMSLLEKEKAHVEGFSPELAVVTHGGGQELEEPLAVRPTSETIMYEMYSKWVQSYRDLPMKMNQWNNVVRWEKRTQFFLRSMEFLWQEAHTAHATHEEAQQMVLDAINVYEEIAQDILGIPVVKGVKSESEKFAGAFQTVTIEALMPDGKALQSGTSHDLGQNFSHSFDIKFQDEKSENQYVWQTSFGLSTRIIGGLIMTHGDDDGLVLPPNVAPVQVVVIPVRTDDYRLIEFANMIKSRLEKQGLRVKVDDREKLSFGYRINDAEIQGVPLRFEIGPKELNQAELLIAVRHLKEKRKISLENLEEGAQKLLDWIQDDLFQKAQQRVAKMTTEVDSWKEFEQVMSSKETRGFIRAYWDETPETEAKIKELTKATTRCVPLTEKEGEGLDVYSQQPAKRRWLFAQAY